MKVFSGHPTEIISSVLDNRELFWALLRREIAGRYKGSLLGLMWSFLHPLLMLIVYAFVFGMIFKSRWAGTEPSTVSFALVLFCGLIVFNVFAETVSRSPTLVIDNANYVKKVVFPLELLPLVSLGSAVFHSLVSTAIWLAFYIWVVGVPHVTMLLFPLAMLPLVLFTAGISWFLAALGVYLRDISQIVGVLTSALLFMSPIFYPLSAVPESARILIDLNPLTYFVELARSVMIYGQLPGIYEWVTKTALTAVVAWAGFAWFQKTRRGFADVL